MEHDCCFLFVLFRAGEASGKAWNFAQHGCIAYAGGCFLLNPRFVAETGTRIEL
ncbi:MAG: hypothetical protein Q8K12_09390 [Thiobacillus sp.]|nr:hypothetical protein [Thiobacillus sp.]